MAYTVFAEKLRHLPRLIIKSVPLRKQLVKYALLICGVDNVDNDLLRLQETVNSMYCLDKIIEFVIYTDKYCPVAMLLKIADRDNAIDVYMGDEYEDVLAEGVWQTRFKAKPAVFTREEKRAWLNQLTDVTLGSDAFFPFSDNIERAHKSGVKYIAQPGGSVRDDAVIECCDKYNMAMVFTGIRLFHH